MIPKQDPPGETAHTVSGKWDHAVLPPGGRLNGWLAGPPHWLPTHSLHKRTLPCRATITRGALPCPHCSPAQREEWKGLLPFWSELRRQSTVWVSLVYRDHLESLPPCCQIVLRKSKEVTASIEVRPETWTTTGELPEAKRARWPADPTPAALVWWRDAELTAWCRAAAVAAVAAREGPAHDPAADGPAGVLGVLGVLPPTVPPAVRARAAKNDEFARRARAGKNGHPAGESG